jgi:hypothetical protein
MTGNSKLISLKVEQLAVTRESERLLEKGSMDPELETARSEVQIGGGAETPIFGSQSGNLLISTPHHQQSYQKGMNI